MNHVSYSAEYEDVTFCVTREMLECVQFLVTDLDDLDLLANLTLNRSQAEF